LRLSYSGDLETRNSSGSRSLGTPCHSSWVGDGHSRVVERTRVWHWPTEKFKQWRAWAVMDMTVDVSPLVSRETYCLRISMEIQLWACGGQIAWPPPADCGICYQAGLWALSPGPGLFPPRAVNCWARSESTETCRQNVWILQFSPFSSELNALFAALHSLMQSMWYS
jgi:hypothetical protein